MKKLIRIQNGKSKVIEANHFEKELELQEIVKKHPELIPLDELGEDTKPILIIGREFPLSDAGFIDLLGIDTSGLITIIEFKLEKNTDIRKAVAQTLEYAANLWGMSYDELDKKCRDFFRSDRCAIPELKDKKTLAQAVALHHKKTCQESDESFAEDDFRNLVATNLIKGEFRLILFCDEVDSRTKKAVEYVHTLSRFDFYCAVAEFYNDEGSQYIRSYLVTKEREDKQIEKQHAGKITFNEFIQTFPEKFKNYITIYQKFSEDISKINGYLSMGTKGFGAYFPTDKKPIKLFEGYPDDIWIMTKAGLAKQEEVVSSKAAQEFEESLNKLPLFRDALQAPGRLFRIKLNKINPKEFENLLLFYFSWHKKWFADKK